MKFNQTASLYLHVKINSRVRASATNCFEKNLYKLKYKVVFGKRMENIRKNRVVKLVKLWDSRFGAKNLIYSFKVFNWTIFDENLNAIELTKTEILFDKLLCINIIILDLPKIYSMILTIISWFQKSELDLY